MAVFRVGWGRHATKASRGRLEKRHVESAIAPFGGIAVWNPPFFLLLLSIEERRFSGREQEPDKGKERHPRRIHPPIFHD
jgi:hypothetical protein